MTNAKADFNQAFDVTYPYQTFAELCFLHAHQQQSTHFSSIFR